MNKNPKNIDIPRAAPVPLSPDESLNSNYTAIPKDITEADDLGADLDLAVTGMEYGTMNEEDARESGYIPPSRPRSRYERRPSSQMAPGEIEIPTNVLLIGLAAGLFALFYLSRSSRRLGGRDVPAWLTAEAMSPVS